MALTENGHIEINGLLLGPGTPYVVRDFKPYTAAVRDRQQDRAWAPGAWSGREDPAARQIPLRVEIDTDSQAAWLAAERDLAAALRASSTDVELRWRLGDVDQLMYVRPRLVDPEVQDVGVGWGLVQCALMALDPRIYSDTEHSEQLVLPSVTGGLTVPLTVPFTIDSTTVAGRATITNAGTEATRLVLRIDANGLALQEPRVTLISGSTITVLRAEFTLDAGQWLTIDTEARTAYLNDTASRRGYMSGDFPMLPPGDSEIAFDAGLYSSAAQLTVTWRDTYA